MRTLLALALILPACNGANDAADEGGGPCPVVNVYCPQDEQHDYRVEDFKAGGRRREECVRLAAPPPMDARVPGAIEADVGTDETLWTVDYWQDGSVQSWADWQRGSGYTCWPSGGISSRDSIGGVRACWSQSGAAVDPVECERSGSPGYVDLVLERNRL